MEIGGYLRIYTLTKQRDNIVSAFMSERQAYKGLIAEAKRVMDEESERFVGEGRACSGT